MNLIHDGTIDIATGRSRKETTWKNKEVRWSELVEKVSTTHRTAELYNEYITAKKLRQDEIKDIGGFVGGYLTGGRRKAGSVMHRQLITLDIDHADPGIWDDFILLYGNAAAVYSTHKHSPEAPRLRLLLPLDRSVFTDEYIAIARRIAGSLGIENFDHTTFEPSRLMYWPSTPKDGEFVFDYQDGPWISADEILGTYRDWKDSSEWPVSVRNYNIIQRNIKKQGDPLEKPGVVGAFCRTYSIAEAISVFLSDVYDEAVIPDRYTYKEGSTAAGLVVYEDKYAYSHHGTDPVSMKLCNAFDLVRLHKFGLKDEDVREGTPGNKLPSYTEMISFATQDPLVKKQVFSDKHEDVKADFAVDFQEETESGEVDDSWQGALSIDKRGNFLSTIDNIFLILKNDQRLKNRLFLNEFEGRLCVVKDLPWRKIKNQDDDFTDDDADCLAHYLEAAHKMPFNHIQKALAKIRTEFRFHPVKDYLNAQKWDQVKRIDTLFIDYLGAADSEYVRAVTRKTLVAAVARVFEPGIKFDTVLTFIGKEGIGKSTLIAKLAKQWFSDCLGDIHTKDGMESLRGVWIMEIAELASFRKADQEAIKRFITSTEDVYRPAYGRQLVRYPRQCIFIATTNKQEFLIGSHGHRRFLPVESHMQQPTKDIFKDLTSKEINQIWGEATTYYKKKESLNLPEKLLKEAENIREQHTEMDDRSGIIETYLDILLPENWEDLGMSDRRNYLSGNDIITPENAGVMRREYVCAAEIWCEVFGGYQKDMTTSNTKYIHDTLKKLKDWEPVSTRRFKIYGTQRGYFNQKNIEKNVNNPLKSLFTNKNVVNNVNKNVNNN